MDMKDEIVRFVREIEELKTEQTDLWMKASNFIASGHVDDAISILNRYFSKKEKLEGAESRLAGILKGHFSDK